jgi:hypothetical protein
MKRYQMEIAPFVTNLPPELLLTLGIVYLLVQGFKYWVDRNKPRDDDDKPAVG